MNVLYLYNSTQTYTNTVFEHIVAFNKYSKHSSFFCHQDQRSSFNIDLHHFDAVVIHYSIRLPFNQVSQAATEALVQYSGLKVLFIQDEYDHTHRAWDWIKRLGIKLVFTVVPFENISRIYPPEKFPNVRFISNLTGYVPDELPFQAKPTLTSTRKLIIGYRGRPLPAHYGQLGQEKIEVGQLVKQYCDSKGILNDIAWTEKDRIYGPKWYEFMESCRAMLGSESGSNVFDWDGTLASQIQSFRKANKSATDKDVYKAVVEPLEKTGLMNQVSPRIFEAIMARTVLVLYEGSYSGVVVPGLHFIALKKDGSNLDEVFALLHDGEFVDEMAEKAYKDVIASGKYSYESFVEMVDEQLAQGVEALNLRCQNQSLVVTKINDEILPTPITTNPIRAQAPAAPGYKFLIKNLLYRVWEAMPEIMRTILKPLINMLLGRR